MALSNTVIGVLLLVLGAASSALIELGFEVAVATLAALAALGAVLALTMKNVQD
ncbi:MAG: hypothetical protein R3322_09600 [Kiloniellales bacterium]|nr:hypothetical protein [Kiloniellales bacterium]